MRRKAMGRFLLNLVLVNTGFAAARAHQEPNVSFKVLYNFTGGKDGCCTLGGLTRDDEGNLFGITYIGGLSGDGDLFKLTPTNHGYMFKMIHSRGAENHCPARSTGRCLFCDRCLVDVSEMYGPPLCRKRKMKVTAHKS